MQHAVHGAQHARSRSSVEAECPEHDGDTYPAKSKIKFEFPELNGRAAFTMHWYDGGNLPPNQTVQGRDADDQEDEDKEIQPPCASGVLFIGDKATMYAAGDYAEKGMQIIGDRRRWTSISRAARATKRNGSSRCGIRRKPAMSNFPDYAGPADRDDSARQPGRVQARPGRMGSGESEADE